jgi:DNA primase catalytic core
MSRITENCVNDIINSADVVDIVGGFVPLKQAGANFIGSCPFHNEKTPSFTVSPARQIFKCFGCGESGSSVDFLKKHKNLSYPEALEYIAGVYNITVEYDESKPKTPEQIEDTKRRERFIKSTVKSYREQLNAAVKKHLKDRGFTDDDIIQWNIGYAPKGGKFMVEKAVDSGYWKEAEELFICGSKNNANWDKLQDRITFPIQDRLGNFTGIAGRQFTEDKKFPKYLNPTDTPLYKKEYTWYGLNFALQAIRKTGYANIVEGYTDVIAMHRKGINNTIAGCGTAITESQIKILKKFTNKVQLVLDGDAAGKKAALKYIDLFVKHGFFVFVKTLPAKKDDNGNVLKDKKNKVIYHDPDSYIKETNPGHRLRLNIKNNNDGIQFKINHLLKSVKTVEQKLLASDAVAVLLSKIENAVLRENYLAWIGKDYKDVKKTVTDLLKDKVTKEARKDKDNVFSAVEHDKNNYTLPKEVDDKWKDIKDDVLKYGMFTYNNIIYMRRGNDKDGFYFRKVSNFSIQIIQHMEDEKRPLKLVSIHNVHNRKRTFDTPSEDFVTLLSFKKMLSRYGNYNWFGSATQFDFDRLISKLYDDMGDGRMITVLGWQTEGFFVFNNAVVVDDRIERPDKYGCFEYKGSSYYIPSANEIYKNNPNRYIVQKQCVYTETEFTFNEIAVQIRKVHREHALNALLFTVATFFSDIIFKYSKGFPLLFLYGEASSGKDNLIQCCQAFWGKHQDALEMTGKANTDKAKIRKFGQFRNAIGHLSEYRSGIADVDAMLKAFWDRKGYERGTLESAVSTESINVEMSIAFTGNYYPTEDALITRMIAEEMDKKEFNDAEKKQFDILNEYLIDGYSSLSKGILALRKVFEEKFYQEYKVMHKKLRNELSNLNLNDRMFGNAAVLGATYKITNEKLDYGFTEDDWIEHIKNCYTTQANKMQTGSVVSQFWDCFFEGVRSTFDAIEQHTEFKIDGDELTLNYNLTYPKYQKAYFNLFKRAAMSKSVLIDKLKKSDAYIKTTSSTRYGNITTSGYVFDLNKIGIKDDLLGFINAKDGTKTPAPTDEPKQENLPFKD